MTKAQLKRAVVKASKANAVEDTPETRAGLKKACRAAKAEMTPEEIELAIDQGYHV